MEPKVEPEKAKPGDQYAVVADEIRALGDDVTESLTKVMLELSKSKPGNVYIAAKKYVDQKGLSLCDFGSVGILGSFLLGRGGVYLGRPGDVVFYVMSDKARTDDILLLHYIDKKGYARLYHARASNFNLKGGVEVQELGDSRTYWISQRKILGKVVEVVEFGSPEWHDLIGQMVDREFLSKQLRGHLKWIEENSFDDKLERLAELRRRMSSLAVQ